MDFINNSGSCCYQIQVVLSLQTLLNNFQMKKSQKSTTESESQRNGCLRLIKERGIIQLQLLKGISKIPVFCSVCRIDTTVNHRIYLFITGQWIFTRTLCIGNGISNPGIFYIFDTGCKISYHTRTQFLTGNKLTGTKISNFNYISSGSGSHHTGCSTFSDSSLFDSAKNDYSFIRIIDRIKNQCLQGCIRISVRSRYLLYNLFQHLINI